MNIYYDIETIPKPQNVLEDLMPEDIKNPRMPSKLESPEIPVFVNRSLKDPAKIAVWLEQKNAQWREDHAAKIAKWNEEALDEKAKFFEKAALSAAYGEIKLFGVRVDGRSTVFVSEPCSFTDEEAGILRGLQDELRVIPCESESEMLAHSLEICRYHLFCGGELADNKFIGFNSNKFDLPFIKRRGWANRVKIPFNTMAGRYVDSKVFVDLREVWQSGDNQTGGSMSDIAKALGIDMSKTTVNGKSMGANFGENWKRDRVGCILYNHQDLIVTEAIAEAMEV